MASRDHTSFYIGGKWLPAQSERRLRRRVTAFTGTHRIGSGRVVRRHRRGRDGGSTAVGRRIGEICGAQIKRAVLELGGKSASIICPDADLELADRDAGGLQRRHQPRPELRGDEPDPGAGRAV